MTSNCRVGSRLDGMDKLVLFGVPTVALAMLIGWLWSHALGLRAALDSETRRADALEAALLECRCN